MLGKLRRTPYLIVGALLCAGCLGIGESHDPASIEIISGIGATDTILAPGPPLVVRILNGAGAPLAGIRVDFIALAPDGETAGHRRGAFVCPATLTRCATFHASGHSVTNGVAIETAEDGSAYVRLQHGIVAGTSTIEITAGNATYHLPIVTLPGARSQIVAVQDTAIGVGRRYRLAPRAADQFGNSTGESVTLQALTPTVAHTSGDTVIAAGVGRGLVLLTSGAVADTAFVSVPPLGRLAVHGAGRIQLMSTDGSDRRQLAATSGFGGAWTPDGASLVFHEESSGSSGFRLFLADTAGNRRIFLASPPAATNIMQPAASTTHIYFSDGSSAVYRANPDGTGVQLVTNGLHPSPSPDGLRVAFMSGQSLHVRVVASGTFTTLHTPGEFPRWSPVGDLIAFHSSNDSLRVIAPDGTGQRSLPRRNINGPVSWSPDGQWIAASTFVDGVLIIRVADGLVLPIAGTRDVGGPIWRPN